MKQKQQLLLLEDVDSLGKKGEIVNAKPGYVRNFLIPQRLAMLATPHTLRKQERLRQERVQQAAVDRREAELLSAKISSLVLETRVKVDPEGHMYGSVSAHDIAQLFHEQGFAIERKFIQLPRPLKETGRHTLSLKLKEGIPASCTLVIIPEGIEAEGMEVVVAPLSEEPKPATE
jgi:large subunit ribosomal protein L9